MTDYDIQTDKSKPYRDPEILQRLYHDEFLTVEEVADIVGATASTVSRWMDKHGIEKRSQKEAQVAHPKLLDGEWLREKYHGGMLSITEISEELGTSRMPVHRALERLDIEPHDKYYKSKITGPSFRYHKGRYLVAYSTYYDDEDIQHFEEVRIHRLIAVAKYGFDAVCNNEIHHKNGVPWDNRPDNIELLSKEDHAKHHFKERGGLQPWQE